MACFGGLAGGVSALCGLSRGGLNYPAFPAAPVRNGFCSKEKPAAGHLGFAVGFSSPDRACRPKRHTRSLPFRPSETACAAWADHAAERSNCSVEGSVGCVAQPRTRFLPMQRPSENECWSYGKSAPFLRQHGEETKSTRPSENDQYVQYVFQTALCSLRRQMPLPVETACAAWAAHPASCRIGVVGQMPAFVLFRYIYSNGMRLVLQQGRPSENGFARLCSADSAAQGAGFG
ncbi:Uncharacterised protein [Kingella potus]|uniref:Uncharacterized protein n=1 Tax=Kingella potus TaxID=265175 RepID=A0A377R046_9NEIS|nr:Uncharacterised protein [Kingella potus]